MKESEFNKRDKAHGKLVATTDYIYSLISPFFSPGFCEGVVEIIKDKDVVVIFVDNEISKNKIEAIIDSDFQEEKEYLRVEVDLESYAYR